MYTHVLVLKILIVDKIIESMEQCNDLIDKINNMYLLLYKSNICILKEIVINYLYKDLLNFFIFEVKKLCENG